MLNYSIGQMWLGERDDNDTLYTFEVIAVIRDQAVVAKAYVKFETDQVYVFDQDGVEITDPIFGQFRLTRKSRAKPVYAEPNSFDVLLGAA